MAINNELGEMIARARKEKRLSLRQLGELVTKKDGTNVSPQYLNDIEHGRRIPSDEVLEQIAQHLTLDIDYVMHLSGSVPRDIRSLRDPEIIAEFYNAFRRRLV